MAWIQVGLQIRRNFKRALLHLIMRLHKIPGDAGRRIFGWTVAPLCSRFRRSNRVDHIFVLDSWEEMVTLMRKHIDIHIFEWQVMKWMMENTVKDAV